MWAPDCGRGKPTTWVEILAHLDAASWAVVHANLSRLPAKVAAKRVFASGAAALHLDGEHGEDR